MCDDPIQISERILRARLGIDFITATTPERWTMPLHPSTFEYLKPTEEQLAAMAELRAAAKTYADAIERLVPDGPDKTCVLRAHRQNAMWINAAVTRLPDGTPRDSS